MNTNLKIMSTSLILGITFAIFHAATVDDLRENHPARIFLSLSFLLCLVVFILSLIMTIWE